MKYKRLSKNKTMILTTFVALICFGFVGYTHLNRNKTEDKWVDGVNYRSPTNEEIKAGNQSKNNIDQKEQQRTTNQQVKDKTQKNNSDKKDTSVIITDANQYDNDIEVRAFMPDVYENGSCIIKLQNNDVVFTKAMPAYKDVTTTICTNATIKRSDLHISGDWKVTVKFESDNYQGLSETQQIKVK